VHIKRTALPHVLQQTHNSPALNRYRSMVSWPVVTRYGYEVPFEICRTGVTDGTGRISGEYPCFTVPIRVVDPPTTSIGSSVPNR
jgi:hypothetical protein